MRMAIVTRAIAAAAVCGAIFAAAPAQAQWWVHRPFARPWHRVVVFHHPWGPAFYWPWRPVFFRPRPVFVAPVRPAVPPPPPVYRRVVVRPRPVIVQRTVVVHTPPIVHRKIVYRPAPVYPHHPAVHHHHPIRYSYQHCGCY
jgi:hypothetical protein